MGAYPIINGVAHDWSSVEIDLGEAAGIFTAITELTYSDNLEPGEAKGTSAQRLALTRGEYSAEGSLTMLLRDSREFIAALGQGFKEAIFHITAMYSDVVAADTITDRVIGCRIGPTDGGGSQGSDPLATTFGLSVMRISWNGYDPLVDMLRSSSVYGRSTGASRTWT
jgi:hypothetical protein